MSQIKWDTTDGLEILTGWDRPLGHHFLLVERRVVLMDGSTDYETVYSADAWAGCSAAEVLGVLTRLGVRPPPDLLPLLHAHREANLGNEIVDYGVIP
jgi:hypothetical protein